MEDMKLLSWLEKDLGTFNLWSVVSYYELLCRKIFSIKLRWIVYMSKVKQLILRRSEE